MTPRGQRARAGGALAAAVLIGSLGTLAIQNVNESNADSVTGTLRVAVAMGDYPPGGTDITAEVIEADGTATPLEVSADEKAQAATLVNDEVTATGDTQSDGTLQVDTIKPVGAASPPIAQAPQNMKVAVVLMRPTGTTFSFTPAHTQTNFFDGPNSVSKWMGSVSGGQAAMTGGVFGPFDTTTNGCGASFWQPPAQTAAATQMAAAGGGFTHIVVITPGLGCSYSGVAFVGAAGVHLNGSDSPSLAEHELGHNLGAWHSGAVYGSSLSDYGNTASVMGSGSSSATGGWAFSANHKATMGWLPAASQVSVFANQDVVLVPSENPTSGGVMLARAAGHYAIERKAAVGVDATMPASLAGIWVYDTIFRSTDDEWVPARGTQYDKPLAVGETFTSGTLTITNLDGTNVRFTFGGTPPPTSVTTSTIISSTSTVLPPPTTTTVGPPPPPGDIGYTSGDDGEFGGGYASFKLAQTFTTTSAATVSKADVLVLRRGSTGTAKCGIYATTAAGLPTGTAVLGVGATVGTAAAWVTCSFPAKALAAGTRYALVLSWSGGNGSNALYWRADVTAPTYAGGNAARSRSSGAWDTTSPALGVDTMFRIYG